MSWLSATTIDSLKYSREDVLIFEWYLNAQKRPSQVIAKVFLRVSSPKVQSLKLSGDWPLLSSQILSYPKNLPMGQSLIRCDTDTCPCRPKSIHYLPDGVLWFHKWENSDSTTEISNLQNTWPPPPSFCFWIYDGDSGNRGPSGSSLGRGLGGGSWFFGRFFTSYRISSSSRLNHLRHRLSSKSQEGKTSRIRGDLERDSRSSSNISHFPHVLLSGPPSCR